MFRAFPLSLCLSLALPLDAGAQSAASPSATINYEEHVKPILAARCFGCHGPRQQQSGLRLDLRQNALRGGDCGVVIVPGHADESKLILRITGSSVGLQMPPTGPLDLHEIAILRAWIDQGADMPGRAVEASAVARQTPARVQAFIDAIQHHDIASVRAALATDKTLANTADASGSTPLMHAAYAGTYVTMKVLVEAGASVNAANLRGATALHWALPDVDKVKLLLMNGAEINARTIEGRTPLYTAAQLPSGAPIVRLLIEVGADIEARTIVGTTPIFAAVTAGAENARLLIDKGANVNAVSLSGTTPLMGTTSGDVVSLLVSHGADVATRSKRGESALADAARRGDFASAKLLLDRGADVNAVDYRGYTPLILAAQYDRDSPDLVRLLLARGADVHAMAEGHTALTIAARRGDTEIVRILREAATKAGPSAQRPH